ncbi:spore coat polysaccharide biosynthesis protein SpsF [Mucilaginibacter yixingensis]|uniref:Spore coat polysaccharide biosynthesis protein SpsF n=1 Tax=Mucilaginibacter yixingensis TaxID=1295612 RepID=A0A2T5JFK3_9SPHI|nr:glycosyltransferase family protein [Mucilaginibacter yixingensis]PTR01126.1 spore coat polysaccharide biosynthesis protein SpsF [Mucilaginibacter yixingensis]
MPKKIVIVVQARMSSSRLPGKVMMPVLGKSLLAQMVRRLLMIRHTATVVIATSQEAEDDIIEQEAHKLKVACYRGSLDNLLDRHYEVGELYNAELVVKIPSDCPLIDPRIIDQTLSYYFDHKNQFDYVSNLHPATWPDGNDVEVMTMDCLNNAWENATRQLELEHTTPYIWENPDKFRIGNLTWETGLDYSMSHRFTIDYEADYQFVKRVFEELYPKAEDFSCQDILDLLERKPEIYELNSQYAGVNWYRHHLDELRTVGTDQTKDAPETAIELI